MKPDQLIKRRGKLGLVAVDLNLEGVQEWLNSHLMTEITVGLFINVYIWTECYLPFKFINYVISLYLAFMLQAGN